MKTLFRVTMLGLLMVIFTAVSVSPIMAQDGDQKLKTELYNKFVKHYDKETITDKKLALEAAEEYIAKFNTPADKDQVTYYKSQITYLKDWIKYTETQAEKERLAAIEAEKLVKTNARLKTFDTAIRAAYKTPTAENWGKLFDAGDEVVDNDAQYALNFKILMAAAGSVYLVEPKDHIDTYNNKIIGYAESVIRDISSGKTSETYGEYNFKFNTKDVALAKMNIVIGNIKLNRQNKDEEGISHYYKSLQNDKNWDAYRIIGNWYKNKAAKIGTIRETLDKNDEANIPKIKEYVAMEKGYVERAIDAYARSYSLAKADSKLETAKKTALYDELKGLFAFRYSEPKEAVMKTDTSINSYVAQIDKKAMPNPATEVTPVVSEEDKVTDSTENKTDDAKSSEIKKDGATMKKGDATMKKEGSTTIQKDAKTPVKTDGSTRTRTVSKTKVVKDN